MVNYISFFDKQRFSRGGVTKILQMPLQDQTTQE